MVENGRGAPEEALRAERASGRDGLQSPASERRWFIAGHKNMADIVFVLIAVGFFGVAWAMVRLCDRV